MSGFGEGFDELFVAVEVVGEAKAFSCAFEGIAGFACEVVDLAEEVDVVVGVVAGAFLVFMGFDSRKFGLPEAEEGGVDVEHFGYFTDGVV